MQEDGPSGASLVILGEEEHDQSKFEGRFSGLPELTGRISKARTADEAMANLVPGAIVLVCGSDYDPAARRAVMQCLGRSGAGIVFVLEDGDDVEGQELMALGAQDYIIGPDPGAEALQSAWRKARLRLEVQRSTQEAERSQLPVWKQLREWIHELRQPLHSMTLYLHAMKRALPEKDVVTRMQVDEALKELGRMSIIIQQHHDRFLLGP